MAWIRLIDAELEPYEHPLVLLASVQTAAG
jgi:hypothetical protein